MNSISTFDLNLSYHLALDGRSFTVEAMRGVAEPQEGSVAHYLRSNVFWHPESNSMTLRTRNEHIVVTEIYTLSEARKVAGVAGSWGGRSFGLIVAIPPQHPRRFRAFVIRLLGIDIEDGLAGRAYNLYSKLPWAAGA